MPAGKGGFVYVASRRGVGVGRGHATRRDETRRNDATRRIAILRLCYVQAAGEEVGEEGIKFTGPLVRRRGWQERYSSCCCRVGIRWSTLIIVIRCPGRVGRSDGMGNVC